MYKIIRRLAADPAAQPEFFTETGWGPSQLALDFETTEEAGRYCVEAEVGLGRVEEDNGVYVVAII